ncbi:MAG TPA: 2-C-methyl-D-erythritol 4-phosphate cytidylyltransferase [Cellulomonas sp.]
MTVAAVLVAAGNGSRLGHTLPKAFVPLDGVPLVVHAARGLLTVPGVTAVVVVVPPDRTDAARELVAGLSAALVVVPGGVTRQASVAAGLAALPDEADVVLVHDAARPFAPVEMVDRVIAAVRAGHPAVIPALPVTDTIKRVGPGDTTGAPVLETVPRGPLRAVQTPQGFAREVLLAAHTAAAGLADDEATAASDDAALVEARGVPVWVVPGDERAAKITTPSDLAVAHRLAVRTEPIG